MTNNKTKYMIRISLLSAIAFVLMYFDFAIPMFPSFLKFDISDIPALLGAFSMGPLAAVIIQLLKNILYIALKGTETGGVGPLANFLTGAAWVVPIGLYYKYKKNKRNAIVSLILGAISMIIVAALSNYFILLPFYAQIMPLKTIIAAGAAVNDWIVDIPTLILFGITPFNILKTTIVSIVTVLLYKKVSPILHR
ncbi:MAG: ECF transporter S component [Eubacteriales bacterium]